MQMPDSASASARNLAVVVLAAGKGTRMNDPAGRPKVLVSMAGKALIDYVLEQAAGLNASRTILIVGHKKDEVIDHLRGRDGAQCEFAEQLRQNGTGHAVMQARPALNNFKGDVLILSGDVPLLSAATLADFQQAHFNSAATASVLSVDVPDAAGYGRIVRDDNGDFTRIVEHKDATDAERAIKEINSGIYLVDAEQLFSALDRISDDNAQGELYLTDIVGILRGDGRTVAAWRGPDWREVQGVNTREQLLALEELLTDRDSGDEQKRI